MNKIFGAAERRVERRNHLGKSAIVAIAVRTYDTTVDDLWEAITTPERLARWFMAVEGDLRVGGRYQLIGNASGTITRCERPQALEVTWEMMGGTSWVNVRLAAADGKAQLTLEHIAPEDGVGKDHLDKYGPGAVGVGWDLGLLGLERHLANPNAAIDHAAAQAWTLSASGKAFIRSSGEAWAEADAIGGETAERAHAKADRTIAFYTGG